MPCGRNADRADNLEYDERLFGRTKQKSKHKFRCYKRLPNADTVRKNCTSKI